MKKFISIMCLLCMCALLTGCFKRDTMEDITIYTTNYPTEYITKKLYGSHSNIYSIYPDGIIIDKYKLTNKQIKDYANASLYIYNGLSTEKSYVNKMRKTNKNLKIIDTTMSMEYNNEYEELWLDPSNFLMMAQNIKSGFEEYINNYYLNKDVSKNYNNLKIKASNLDAKIKQIVSNSNNKVIVTSSNLFKYLEKYGLTVYVINDNQKDINKAKELVKNGIINYIFVKKDEELNNNVKDFINDTGVETAEFDTLTNLNETQRNNKEDYFSIMNSNLELLKNELY